MNVHVQPGPIPKSASAPDPSTFLLHSKDSPPTLPRPTQGGGGGGGGAHAHKGLIVGAVGGVQGSGDGGKLLKEPEGGGKGRFSTIVPQVCILTEL